MTQLATRNSVDPATCRHPYHRVRRKASLLQKMGFGGYYRIGTFDTVVYCRDCGHEHYISAQGAPLCQECLGPMAAVTEAGETVSCSDPLTDSLLSNIDLKFEKHRHQERLDRYWNWYCAREERKEAERRNASHDIRRDELLLRRGVRLAKRSSMKQIWSYCCTSSNCTRQGKLVWLHTPGD